MRAVSALDKGGKPLVMVDRYSRQVFFPGVSEEGQKKLGESSAVIIGCGAVGTVIATSLVRAAVVGIRIVDRDFIEYHNLQREVFNSRPGKHTLSTSSAGQVRPQIDYPDTRLNIINILDFGIASDHKTGIVS